MNYSVNRSVTPTMFNTKHVSEQKSDAVTINQLTQQYSSFVFLVSMKYLRDEEKSKNAVKQIFLRLNNTLKHNNIVNVKAWLYNETKDYYFKHQNIL